jgi:hypothetical protein
LPSNGTGFGFTVTLMLPVRPTLEFAWLLVVVELDGPAGFDELLHAELIANAAAARNTTQ